MNEALDFDIVANQGPQFPFLYPWSSEEEIKASDRRVIENPEGKWVLMYGPRIAYQSSNYQDRVCLGSKLKKIAVFDARERAQEESKALRESLGLNFTIHTLHYFLTASGEIQRSQEQRVMEKLAKREADAGIENIS